MKGRDRCYPSPSEDTVSHPPLLSEPVAEPPSESDRDFDGSPSRARPASGRIRAASGGAGAGPSAPYHRPSSAVKPPPPQCSKTIGTDGADGSPLAATWHWMCTCAVGQNPASPDAHSGWPRETASPTATRAECGAMCTYSTLVTPSASRSVSALYSKRREASAPPAVLAWACERVGGAGAFRVSGPEARCADGTMGREVCAPA